MISRTSTSTFKFFVRLLTLQTVVLFAALLGNTHLSYAHGGQSGSSSGGAGAGHSNNSSNKTVYNEDFEARPQGKTYSDSFKIKNAPVAGLSAELEIKNGDGKDLVYRDCSNLQKFKLLECKFDNFKTYARILWDRPTQFSLFLNNQLVASTLNLPPEKGSLKIPVRVFAQNSVKVVIKGLWSAEIKVKIKLNSQTVNLPPVARISADPLQGIAPQTVAFSGLASTDPENSPLQYLWNFGDGASAQGFLVSHIYTQPGTYDARLTVTDDRGLSNTAIQRVVIAQNQLPLANINITSGLTDKSIIVDASASTDSDGTIVEYIFDFGDQSGVVTQTNPVLEKTYTNFGAYQVNVKVKDNKGGIAETTSNVKVQDVRPPILSILSPTANERFTRNLVTFLASSDEPLSVATIQLNSEAPIQGVLNGNGTEVSGDLILNQSGTHRITLRAKDISGNESIAIVDIVATFNVPPLAKITVLSATSGVAPLTTYFDASESVDSDGDIQEYIWDFGDGNQEINQFATVTHEYLLPGDYTVQLTVKDNMSAINTASVQIRVTAAVVPPSPTLTSIPALSNSRVQLLAEQVGFLINGPNATQKDMLPDFLVEQRAAVIRGKVFDTDGNPISGVKIDLIEMPEAGYTATRADGQYDLVVNGGGTYTVRYERNGYFPLQRKIKTDIQDYFWTENAIMIRPDSKATRVALGSAISQVAKGSEVVDQSGSRTGTIYLPPNTTANLQMKDGSLVPVPSLTLRVSEFTVGTDGPRRMPADLPASTSYTYAAELSADEAIALGADHVVFSKPVPFYVDNFLNFPAGTAVPVGTYNRKQGFWEGEVDGVVVKVLNIVNNQAVIDVTGLGPASAADLASLQITNDELTRIAETYAIGKSFWRAQLNHFSAVDCNWLQNVASTAGSNGYPAAGPNKVGECPPTAQGCIIDINQQSVGETIPLVGTPYSLNYSSLLSKGRSSESEITIPIAAPPSIYSGVSVRIEVAGQVADLKVNLGTTAVKWLWDGKDGFGREVIGGVNARISIEFESTVGYLVTQRSIGPNRRSFSFPQGLQASTIPGRNVAVYSRTFNLALGNNSLAAQAFGGWTLSHLHSYNPLSRILTLGSGRTIDTTQLVPVVTRLAGQIGQPGFAGDGGPARRAQLSALQDMVRGPDGSLYVVDSGNLRIRKIDSNFNIQTIAGNGTSGSPAIGSLAVNSSLLQPAGVAVAADGAVYFSDRQAQRIYKITPAGVIEHFAGTGVRGFTGDGGLAIQAQLSDPGRIILSDDGSLYVAHADNQSSRIRKISANGIISTVAGGGVLNDDVGDARQLNFSAIRGLAIGNNNDLFVIAGTLVWRIREDGSAVRIAGNINSTQQEPFGPARDVSLSFPRGLAVHPNGTVFFGDAGRILSIENDGNLRVVAGGSQVSIGTFENMPADKVNISVNSLVLMGFDSIAIMESSATIRLYSKPLPVLNSFGYSIASEDGTEIYQFSSLGTHQRTLFSKTGATKWDFRYDANGQLISVVDAHGNTTTISRQGNGVPTQVVGPFGHSTSLNVNSLNQLVAIQNPSSEVIEIGYNPQGLMASYKKPKGDTSYFEYNSLGELTKDTDPSGQFKTFTKGNIDSNTYQVTMNSPMQRQTKVKVESTISGTVYTTTFPDGHLRTEQVSRTEFSNNPTRIFSEKNYSQSTDTTFDPRLGGTTKYLARGSTLINGRGVNSSQSHVYSPQSATDFFAFIQSIDSTVGSQTLRSTYRSLNKSLTVESSLGRTSNILLNRVEKPLQVQVGSQLPVSYSYDVRGFVSTIQQGDRLTRLNYNQLGQLSSIVNAEGHSQNFQLDASNRVTRSIAADGGEVGFNYDLNSNLTGLQPPDRLLHQFILNALDLVTHYTPPLVPGMIPTRYIYNNDRQLVQEIRPNGVTINSVYNNSTGLLESVGSPGKEYLFGYDTFKNLAFIHASNNITLSMNKQTTLDISRSYTFPAIGAHPASTFAMQWTVDTFGRQQRLFAGSGVSNDIFGYVYDSDNLLIEAGGLSYTRNSQDGQVITDTLGTVRRDYVYSNYGEIEKHTTQINGSSQFEQSLTRDKLGRVTVSVETQAGQTSTTNYIYDVVGRLKSVSRDGVIKTYDYDRNGNRVGAGTSGASTISAVYDDQDRLLSYGDVNYQYNLHGDLQTKSGPGGVSRYSYDEFGQLSRVELPNADVIEYLIAGENHRVVKKLNGVVTQRYVYYNNMQLGAELRPTGALKSVFVYGEAGHSPEYMIQNGVSYRYVKDVLGSIRMVVNANTGDVVQRLDYDEFGVVVSDTNPGFQPFGFAGGLYDSDTKLVRFGARDYDPTIGRWTAKDPIGFAGGDTNLYAYVGGDPVSYVDPSGLWGFQIGGSIAGMFPAFGGGVESGIAITYSNGQLQIAGYQSGQARAGAGLFGGIGLNVTVTPDAKNVCDLGGGSVGGGFDTPLFGGSVQVSTGSNPMTSYTGGVGPGVIGDVYGSVGYTHVSSPITFGGR